MGLLLFFGLAPDKLLDVGMVGVQNDHLRGSSRFSSRLDDARERIEALHEAQRAGSSAASPQVRIFFAYGREVRARTRSPLEEHAFGLGQIEDRLERVTD